MTIEEQEDALFSEWEKHLKQRFDNDTVDNLMCYDGLHQTGDADKSSGYWLMKRNFHEEGLWRAAKIRPLFLTKDHNLQGDNIGVDIRQETGLRNDTDNIYYAFYAKYLLFLYGLSKMNVQDGSYPPLEEACDADLYLQNFYECPVVRMNLKKIAGNASCPDWILDDYINQDEDFIRRQINIYDANVIVCCDGTEKESNPIMKLLKQMYSDLKPASGLGDCTGFIYYSEKARVVFIHEWHPSYRGISYEDFYSAIPQLGLFLKQHPVF